MFVRRTSNTIKRWAISSTPAIVVLGLSGLAIGQETRVVPSDQDRGSTVTIVKTSPNANDFRMATRWEKASEVIGKKVTNGANESLGKIEDIVVDATSGRILYGVLSFGGFAGMGDKFFAIPWSSLQLPSDNSKIVLNVDKDQLKGAPGFDKKNWPNFADEQYATTTYKYYNVTPYWQTEGRETRLITEKSTDGKVTTYRERWYQPARNWQKSNDLIGKDVKNSQHEDLGRISDLSLDPETGRILYGILSFKGKYYSIPYSALTLSSDSKNFILDVSKDQLKDSVAFEKDKWPNMADERWANETFVYYKVQPYWTETVVTEQR